MVDSVPHAGRIAKPADDRSSGQPPGEAHNDYHRDYSQTFRAVQRACCLDGAPADLAELLQGPDAGEVSLEGALPGARLPALPLVPLASLV